MNKNAGAPLNGVILISLLTALSGLSQGASGVVAAPANQGSTRTFPETNKTVSGKFLAYWDEHGGLAQQGYPISEQIEEKSDTDGKTYSTQYFERAVFEMHPENPAPYDVLLSLLGVFRYEQKYSDGAANQVPNNEAGSRVFNETGKRVGGIFLDYWQAHGGLAQQGYPISDEFDEKNDLDGKTYRVQYFERAVFELHPENPEPYNVLLSQLGTFQYRAKHQGATLPAPTPSAIAQRTNPGTRSTHALVYNSALKMVLLANGGDEAGEPALSPGKVWGWNGTEWKVVAEGGPEVRGFGGVAYDSKQSKLVLFGGGNPARYYGDTWELNGTAWSRKDVSGPGIRHHTAMVYDAARDQVILQGGGIESSQDPATSRQVEGPDTWAYDEQGWRQVATTGPGPRAHHAMVYDPVHSKVFLFGGAEGATQGDDLWEWDGSSWRAITSAGPVPSRRRGAALAYDEERQRLVLFGGVRANGTTGILNDTWEYDGTAWQQVTVTGSQPDARSDVAIAYDPGRHKVVLYGGFAGNTTYSDTWEYNGASWKEVNLP